jgi:dienelactone hydrolase
MLSRRRVLELGIASSLSGGLLGCGSQPGSCPISWVPSIVSPVFYGYADYVACQGVQACVDLSGTANAKRLASAAQPTDQLAVRVYFPSLDGSPQNAALLSGCRRFPLVIFVHGDCDGNPYEQWVDIPAQLARSGYVVAVTNYGGRLATGDTADTMPLHLVYNWMRNLSPYAGVLLSAPSTAVMGHSYGGTLAAQLAGEVPIAAYASLSAVFGESNYTTAQPASIKVPSLFLWGTGGGTDEVLYGPPGHAGTDLWPAVRMPTHAVAFKNAHHADYMQPGTAGKCDQTGACTLVRSVTADFLTAFLSKYMAPEAAAVTPSYIPDSLFVPPGSQPFQSQQQQFYTGSYLIGFAASKLLSGTAASACVQNMFWRTASGAGTINLTQ